MISILCTQTRVPLFDYKFQLKHSALTTLPNFFINNGILQTIICLHPSKSALEIFEIKLSQLLTYKLCFNPYNSVYYLICLVQSLMLHRE